MQDYVPVIVISKSVYGDTSVDWFSCIYLRASEERMRHYPRETKPSRQKIRKWPSMTNLCTNCRLIRD